MNVSGGTVSTSVDCKRPVDPYFAAALEGDAFALELGAFVSVRGQKLSSCQQQYLAVDR